MKLTDLEPCDLGFRKRPGLGIAFNCPGDCCARQRQLQARAAKLEASGDPAAPAARHEAFTNHPFRIWIAFSNSTSCQATIGERCHLSGYTIDELYTRSGVDWADLTIAEEIDRAWAGHARIRITGGEVQVK